MKEEGSGALGGRYVYCVTDQAYPKNMQVAGIERKPVYGIAYRGISAVVHKCSLKPYRSDDAEQIRKWAIAHHTVTQKCWTELGSVIPMAFDTIVKGSDLEVKRWLKDDYERLAEKLRGLSLKAEYGVQIFWNPKIATHGLIEDDVRVKKLRLLQQSSLGMDYILAKKIKQELAGELKQKAEHYFRDFYSRVADTVDAIHVDPVRRVQGEQMLMHLSVLVTNGKQCLLQNKLAEINGIDGFSVRLTGPWAPYSFA